MNLVINSISARCLWKRLSAHNFLVPFALWGLNRDDFRAVGGIEKLEKTSRCRLDDKITLRGIFLSNFKFVEAEVKFKRPAALTWMNFISCWKKLFRGAPHLKSLLKKFKSRSFRSFRTPSDVVVCVGLPPDLIYTRRVHWLMIKNVTQAVCRVFTSDVGQMLIDSDGRHLSDSK